MLPAFSGMRARLAFIVFALLPLAHADPLHCSLAAYKALPGLNAAVAGDVLTLTWEGDHDETVRLRLALESAAPVIRELAIKQKSGPWATVLSNAAPVFRVDSGLRRITNQQLDPLAGLGIKITPDIIEKYKWEAFWDAPLNLPGSEAAHNDCTPPQQGVLSQPGLPRSPDEVHHAAAVFHSESCAVKTNGARLEVSFPGLSLGVFEGRLQFTV